MQKAHILLVEDEAETASKIGTSLRKLGHEVPDVSVSGDDAVNRVRDLHPDLVLMDVKLRGSTEGIEAANRIRNDYHLPVVYLTSDTDETTFLRAARTNPAGYVRKPCGERELGTTVEAALERHRAGEQLRKSEALHRAVLQAALDPILLIDHEAKVTDANQAAERAFGHSLAELTSRALTELILPPVPEEREWSGVFRDLLGGRSALLGRRVEMDGQRADGSVFPVEMAITRIEIDGPPQFAVTVRDITQRKREALEMERLVRGLEEALARSHTLKGLLPMCASCKRIRDDGGAWQQVERFIMQNAPLRFTYGCCPGCANKLLKDFLRARS